MSYKIDKAGLDFIKSFEGFSPKACKCLETEKYYTIGYGHYGADVKKDATITKDDALKLLEKDVAKHVSAVNKLNVAVGQNSFNALVSFSYNCGSGNLSKLCKDRTISEIAEKILLYNKSGGKIITGLVNRRKKEQTLIKKDLKYYPKYTGSKKTLNEALKELQIDNSYAYRKKIAIANGIQDYSGLASQNIYLFNLLKNGKLLKI